MKIVVYGPEMRIGVWSGDWIIDAARAVAEYALGRTLPATLAEVIAGGEAVLDLLRSACERCEASGDSAGVRISSAGVRFHPPHVHGAKIACAGGNFADHLAQMAVRGRGVASQPSAADLGSARAAARAGGIWGFWKIAQAAAGDGDDIVYPAGTQLFDYEAELAVIIGRGGKSIRSDRFGAHVWGITLFVDWTARDVKEAAAPFQFTLRKNFDTSYSVGPCILVADDVPLDVTIETRVNGELRQRFNSGEMIFSYAEYLEYLSRNLTFYPGDMISGGTGAGTAADSSPFRDGVYETQRFLKPGDTVEVSSDPIGSLRSTIVAEPT